MKKCVVEVEHPQLNESLSYESFINRRAGIIRQGNWCGHSPALPRFFKTPDAHKARPKIITWAIDAWSRFYESPLLYFNEIRMYRHSDRQQRSESREALSSIAQVILHYTELASLRVGVPHVTDGFRSLTIEFIAKKAGIGVKRAQRAIKLLVRAGYMKMIERFDFKDDRFIGLAAVKCLTPSFFKACGINLQALSAQRRLARKRLNKHHAGAISEAQERQSQANSRKILNFIAPEGNAKVHLDAMKSMLSRDEKTEDWRHEKEMKRRRSLERIEESGCQAITSR